MSCLAIQRLTLCLAVLVLAGCVDPEVEDRAAELAEREVGNPGGTNFGEFGPSDAYEDGDVHPFYGSENQWSRRMFSERAADLYYKRRGQRQLLSVLDGDPGAAIAMANARLGKDPGDAESLFVKAVALAQLDRIFEAGETMQSALDAGLPFARFLAGPRDLLEPLSATAEFKLLVEGMETGVLHGPMLGAVTDTSVRLWIRTAVATDFEVVVERGGERHVASGATHATRDYTGIAIVEGLSPDTEYSYRIRLGDGEDREPGDYRLRTSPRVGESGKLRIGFGGCAGYTPAHERVWDTIAGQDLDAFLMLGDNVYIDLPEEPGAFHDYTYYRRQSRPEFRRLVSSTPIYAIWDDHDAAVDDIWLGPYVNRPPWKQSMVELFRRNWNNPAYGTESRPGTWFEFRVGDVDFFMLDGRTYRSNPFADSPTMLGKTQREWLLAGLANSTARFKVIASPVAWAEGAKPGSRDTWSGFLEERNEILGFVEGSDIRGVVLVSSDRHRSEARAIRRESGYAFHDLLSGQLTNVHTHPIEEGALFSYNLKNSFGVLNFDSTGADPRVRYEIHSIDNELIDSLLLRHSDLRPRGAML